MIEMLPLDHMSVPEKTLALILGNAVMSLYTDELKEGEGRTTEEIWSSVISRLGTNERELELYGRIRLKAA